MIDKLVKNYRTEYLNKQVYIFSSSHFLANDKLVICYYQDKNIIKKDIVINISALDPFLDMLHIFSFVSIIIKYLICLTCLILFKVSLLN